MLSESQNIEYKESWRDEYLKWICGFDQEKLFAEHASQPRNRNIANAFYKAGFIETWGRGINKIRQGLKSAGLPEPKIENNASGTLITIYRKTAMNGGNVGNMSETNGGYTGGNVAVIELTKRQYIILSCIAKDPTITAKQVAAMQDMPLRTIERELSALQKIGVLHREGSPRTGKWVVKDKRFLN